MEIIFVVDLSLFLNKGIYIYSIRKGLIRSDCVFLFKMKVVKVVFMDCDLVIV